MLLLLAGRAMPAEPPVQLDMYVGEARVLQVSPTRVAIGNGKVISASAVGPEQLLVLAEAAGSSSLHLWLKDGVEREIKVQVRETDPQPTLEEVQRLLAGVNKVKARLVGSKIVLEGDMASDDDQARAQAIQKLYPQYIVNFIGKVGWEKMIYLDVKVLELTTKGSQDLGIRWDSSVNGPAAGVIADFYRAPEFRYIPGAPVDQPAIWPPRGFINLTSLITSRINLLVQDGEAQVLAAPSLATRSGSKAHFVAGGEIPLPVQEMGQTKVEMKEYGVILDVTPVTDNSGVIYAKVEVEVSSLDRSVTVLGIPGFLKRKSSAEFNAREGETVVLNGMYAYENSSDTQKTSGLASLPLIGALFRDKAGSTSKREVAIIMTPRLVHPTPDPLAQAHDVNREKLEDFNQAVRDKNLLPKQPASLTVTE